MKKIIFLLLLASLSFSQELKFYEGGKLYKVTINNFTGDLSNHSGNGLDSILAGYFNNLTVTTIDSMSYFVVDSIYFNVYNTRWDDLRFPATALDPQNKNDNVPTFDTTNIGWAFDSTATETLYGIAQMPHSYLLESDISPHIHWSSEATDTVVWEFGYKWADIGGVLPDNYILDTLYAIAEGDVDEHAMDDFTDMDGTGIDTVSSMIKWKLSRLGGHAQDDSDGAALLWELDFHFQKDADGSKSEYIK